MTFKTEDEIIEHNENNLHACEDCNVCFVKHAFHHHMGHDYIGKPKQTKS